MNCRWCGEPIERQDHEALAMCEPMHRECLYRSVMGSVAHMSRRCSCYVAGSSEGDDPALSRRDAAKAAFEMANVNSRN